VVAVSLALLHEGHLEPTPRRVPSHAGARDPAADHEDVEPARPEP